MPRRQLHREFLRWLKLNRARFAIGIALGKRTDEVLEFSFVGINRAIAGYRQLNLPDPTDELDSPPP
jgi:hypothetical protein